eukprot:74162-Chlamydomonas_euryale.AAC.1
MPVSLHGGRGVLLLSGRPGARSGQEGGLRQHQGRHRHADAGESAWWTWGVAVEWQARGKVGPGRGVEATPRRPSTRRC